MKCDITQKAYIEDLTTGINYTYFHLLTSLKPASINFFQNDGFATSFCIRPAMLKENKGEKEDRSESPGSMYTSLAMGIHYKTIP